MSNYLLLLMHTISLYVCKNSNTFVFAMQKIDNYTFLTSAPVDKVILTMAVPTIISMLVTSLYNMADTFFVGKLSTQATASVGIVFSVMFFIQAFGFFFGHGSGNYISRELGAKRHKNAQKMASTAFFYSMMCGLLFTVIGEIFLKPLSILLGSTPTILPYTEDYMGIILLGAPFLTASLTINNQMRFQGNARFAMWGIVTGTLINVVLNPLFIFGFNMGVRGSALATVIGQIISFCILLRLSYINQNIGIHFKNFSPSWNAIREIFYGGSPSLSRQGLECTATIVLNLSAGAFGDAAIAAMSIVTRIAMFIMSIVIGLGQGFQPLCGFCYGAKLYSRLKKGYWFTVKLGTLFLIMCAVVGLSFSNDIIGLFRNDPEVIKIGSAALGWQLLGYPFNEFTMVSNMCTQTCRKPWRANLLASARRGLFFIPLIIILPKCFGLFGLEITQLISDSLACMLTIPIMIYTFRELR